VFFHSAYQQIMPNLSFPFYQLDHITATEQRSHASAAVHAELNQPLWIHLFAPAPRSFAMTPCPGES
jgi:hypothetical protein